MKELIYKGSTKDIYQISGEEYLFEFSDRYSIFDYGEMPDLIKSKGVSSARLTSFLFPYLEEKTKIKTHFLKMGEKSNQIIVKRFHVPRDYDSDLYYKNRPINAFLPLEVIFRLGVPQGSSLLKRGDYKVNEKFQNPLIEFSTKLESIDRMLTHSEAKELAGLNDQELEKLIRITQHLAMTLKEKFKEFNIDLWDGKFEFAFIESDDKNCRDFMLVDSISLDELRLTLDDLMLSKEVLRNFYKHTDWYQNLLESKEKYGDSFRAKISKPTHLPIKLLSLIESMYGETTELIATKSEQNKAKLVHTVLELKNEYINYR